jgi:heat shock protein HslJ
MYKFFSILIALLFFCWACSTQKPAGRSQIIVRGDTSFVKDSIEFYPENIGTSQKNYMEKLVGSWTVDTMHRQAKMEAETLSNVFLSFKEDNTFTGSGGCNRISGSFILKGTSIKFSNIISTKMACDRLEQEGAFLKLLQETVSAYTVDNNVLWLRDGASNIVFHASRRN